LVWPLRVTISVKVLPSTYFLKCASGWLRSFIIRRNNQGRSLVPWGTPDGTAPHLEKQSLESFTCCNLFTPSEPPHVVSEGKESCQLESGGRSD
jgi:hypothetical protein